MSKSMYYVIHNSDGETFVNSLSKEDLLERLEEGYYGEVEFLDSLPDSDTGYWGEKVLIIKGDIVKPEPKEIVKKYEIE